MTKVQHVAIIGGGLIGMMSAFYLQKAGFRITLFDKSDIATESSWAGGGILSPLYPWKYSTQVNELAAWSQAIYPSLIQEIESVSGISAEFRKTGLLLDHSELDESAERWLQQNQRTCELLESGAALLRNLNPVKDYSLIADVAQVRNPRLAKSLARCLQRYQARLVTHSEVLALQSSSTGQVRLTTDDGTEMFDKVVVCAGAWTARLLAKTGLNISIKPIRGQMLLFKAFPDFLQSIVLAQGHYIIPRQDGHILVGSTMEDVGFDKSTTADALQRMREFITEFAPGLLDFELEKQWAGLRPGSPSGIPVIDVHPDMKNVFINAGHFRNGVLLAPASAKLLTDIVLDRPSTLEVSNYSYEEFDSVERVS